MSGRRHELGMREVDAGVDRPQPARPARARRRSSRRRTRATTRRRPADPSRATRMRRPSLRLATRTRPAVPQPSRVAARGRARSRASATAPVAPVSRRNGVAAGRASTSEKRAACAGAATSRADAASAMIPAMRAYVGLGANLGDRERTLRAAVEALAANPRIEVLAVSSLRETDPVGPVTDQPRFLNGAVALETSLPARELLDVLLQTEAAFGRTARRPARRPEDARPRSAPLRRRADRRARAPGAAPAAPRAAVRAGAARGARLDPLRPGLHCSR